MDLIDRQPEERTDKCTETHACDLISRQDAIDVIADYLRKVCLVFSDYMTDDESKECATCILQSLPSAQPELIRCEDCKYWEITWANDYAPNHHYCPLVDGVRKSDFYCADAERRTDETD